jgi:hypothetical protein
MTPGTPEQAGRAACRPLSAWRDAQQQQVCRAFGVPPWLIGLERRPTAWRRLRWRILGR